MLKYLALILILLSSSTAYAEWTEVVENVDGSKLYVDVETIRKHDGYVYFWNLNDFLEPIDDSLSAVVYWQGDCKIFKLLGLSFSEHKEPMGEGTGDVQEPVEKGWIYYPPNSPIETLLKSVCDWVK